MTMVCLFISLGDSEDNSEMDYKVYVEGPRTVYEGVAKLYFDENTTACINYTFDLVPGRLSGPSVSSAPGQPLLPFDEVHIFPNEIYINWERNRSDLQDYPVETHRGFTFYIIKTEFNADDLAALLSDWGKDDSVWDLDGDGKVGGSDLSHVLGGWKID